MLIHGMSRRTWPLDVASIEQNRVGMRYYRGVLGYFYDQIVRFSAHPNNPDVLGQFETDWRTELEDMQALDRYVFAMSAKTRAAAPACGTSSTTATWLNGTRR